MSAIRKIVNRGELFFSSSVTMFTEMPLFFCKWSSNYIQQLGPNPKSLTEGIKSTLAYRVAYCKCVGVDT
jgi:hypothetical protein